MRFSAVLIAASLGVTGLAAPALADKHDDCRMQSDIVKRAVELRLERKSKRRTTKILSSGDDAAVAEKYLPAVPYLVDWVYEDLKRRQLRADPGPDAAYYETCMSQ